MRLRLYWFSGWQDASLETHHGWRGEGPFGAFDICAYDCTPMPKQSVEYFGRANITGAAVLFYYGANGMAMPAVSLVAISLVAMVSGVVCGCICIRRGRGHVVMPCCSSVVWMLGFVRRFVRSFVRSFVCTLAHGVRIHTDKNACQPNS